MDRQDHALPAPELLWAKTGPAGGWMDLPRHMEDSAEVARIVLRTVVGDGALRGIAQRLGLELEQACALLIFLAGVHDVGKATSTFAHRADVTDSQLSARLSAAGMGPLARDHDHPHAAASQVILCDWLIQQGMERRTATALADVVGAHHGAPSTPAQLRAATLSLARHPQAWHLQHRRLLERIAALSGFEPTWPMSQVSLTDAMLACGVIIVCDWLASDPEHFELTAGAAADSAARAASAASLRELVSQGTFTPAPTAPGEFYAARFGWGPQRSASAVQSAVAELVPGTGAGIWCIEAAMGAGKTEAALAAAELLGRQCGRGSVVVAGPTMATTDALYARVSDWGQRAFASATPITTALSHSRAWMSAAPSSIFDEDSSLTANDWLTGSKRALLGGLTVATIDQLLAACLSAKHNALRHLGMACSVVLIDEVHSYSPHMIAYLERLLTWLGSMQVPVVMLSATLPTALRQRLMGAWAGAAGVPVQLGQMQGYPRISALTDTGPVMAHPAPGPSRQVHLVRGLDEQRLLQQVDVGGGVGLIVRNTVARAQQTYLRACQVLGQERVMLLHSRLIGTDRLARERALTAALGPNGDRPEALVVVATQVVEQSLDIDADALLTDIAPADVLLQRIGRLHRHARPRPSWAGQAQVGIEAVAEGEDGPRLDRSATAVYPAALLMATWAQLRERAVLQVPEQIPHLVEAMFSAQVPAAWQERYEQALVELAELEADAQRRAQVQMIPAPDGAARLFGLYRALLSPEQSEGGLGVRGVQMGPAVVPLIQGRPLVEGVEPAAASLPAPVRLFHPRAVQELMGKAPAGWARDRRTRALVPLELDDQGGASVGARRVRYEERLGLVVE